MRIGILMTHLDPTLDGVVVGGAASGMINLSRALSSRGHTLDLIVGEPSSSVGRIPTLDVPWASVNTISIHSGRTTTLYGGEFTLKCIATALREWRRLRPDVIHGHSGFAAYASTTAIVSALIRVPAIHTLYCPLSDLVDGRRSRTAQLFDRPITFTGLSSIVAISENIKASLVTRGVPGSRIHTVPPALDVNRYIASSNGNLRHRLGLTKRQLLVTYVGSLNPAKGIEFLLDAFARIAPAHPELRLVTAVEPGNARASSRSREIAQRVDSLGIRSRITELGVVPDMPELLAGSDIVVIPFLSTSGPSDYPLVMIEAMAAGTPVVATRVGGIPEVIREGETGLLCAPGSVDELAAQVERLMCNEELRRQLGANGADAVAAKFDSSRVAALVEEIFQEAVSGAQV